MTTSAEHLSLETPLVDVPESSSSYTCSAVPPSSSAPSPSEVYPMFSHHKFMREGDLVIMQLTREVMQPVVIQSGEVIQNRYGMYHHSDLIGVPFGSRVASVNGKGFVWMLRPTPELWTLALPHRTQILYVADISYILAELNVRPGSVVVEAGTGSGSMSHSVARAIAPHGFLHSFEFHQPRAEKAKAEFEDHGMSSLVRCRHRNVCKDGFELENVADAVFLDLPAPWEAIKSAKAALKNDKITRICCFSPCIEQVLRTVTMLSSEGFSDISMSECLLRQHEVNPQIALPPVGSVTKKLEDQEVKKEARRRHQIEAALSKKRKVAATSLPGSPASGGVPQVSSGADENGEGTGEVQDRKEEVDQELIDHLMTQENAPAREKDGRRQVAQPVRKRRGDPVPYGMNLSRPAIDARGHTSYLTFATLFPAGLRPGDRSDDAEEDAEGDVEMEADGRSDALNKALALMTEEQVEKMMDPKTAGHAELISGLASKVAAGAV